MRLTSRISHWLRLVATTFIQILRFTISEKKLARRPQPQAAADLTPSFCCDNDDK